MHQTYWVSSWWKQQKTVLLKNTADWSSIRVLAGATELAESRDLVMTVSSVQKRPPIRTTSRRMVYVLRKPTAGWWHSLKGSNHPIHSSWLPYCCDTVSKQLINETVLYDRPDIAWLKMTVCKHNYKSPLRSALLNRSNIASNGNWQFCNVTLT